MSEWNITKINSTLILHYFLLGYDVILTIPTFCDTFFPVIRIMFGLIKVHRKLQYEKYDLFINQNKH